MRLAWSSSSRAALGLAMYGNHIAQVHVGVTRCVGPHGRLRVRHAVSWRRGEGSPSAPPPLDRGIAQESALSVGVHLNDGLHAAMEEPDGSVVSTGLQQPQKCA